LPTTFINKFERSYGTYRKGGGKLTVINDIGSVCPKKDDFIFLKFNNNNDHGVDVSIIIVI